MSWEHQVKPGQKLSRDFPNPKLPAKDLVVIKTIVRSFPLVQGVISGPGEMKRRLAKVVAGGSG